jgi:hypothetical protein
MSHFSAIVIGNTILKYGFPLPDTFFSFLTPLWTALVSANLSQVACETVEKGLCLTYVPVEKISFKSP